MLTRVLSLVCLMSWAVSASPGVFSADAPRPLPAALAPLFELPEEFAHDEAYRSPLVFDNGQSVKTAEEWTQRRAEIRATWDKLMGPWPPILEKPAVAVLDDAEPLPNLRHQHLRLEVAPGLYSEDVHLLLPPQEGKYPAVLVVYYDSATLIARPQSGEPNEPVLAFARLLAERGFVTLAVGASPGPYYPNEADCALQPLSFQAYMAANCWHFLANLPEVDATRIGVLGHSYGGKWSMFAACLFDKFACCAVSDPGIVFDETRPNVNYWEPWYLGHDRATKRAPGVLTAESPRTGAYKQMMADGRDLHELHALLAPRPFFVSGGSEDPAERWRALKHLVAVNMLLGHWGRVGMSNRPGHTPTLESNALLFGFFEHFLQAAP